MKKYLTILLASLLLPSVTFGAPELYSATNLPAAAIATTAFTNLLTKRVGRAVVIPGEGVTLWAKIVGTNTVTSGIYTSNKVTFYWNVTANGDTNRMTTGNVYQLDAFANGTNPVVVYTNITAATLGAVATIEPTGMTNLNTLVSNGVRIVGLWVTRNKP